MRRYTYKNRTCYDTGVVGVIVYVALIFGIVFCSIMAIVTSLS